MAEWIDRTKIKYYTSNGECRALRIDIDAMPTILEDNGVKIFWNSQLKDIIANLSLLPMQVDSYEYKCGVQDCISIIEDVIEWKRL